MRCKNILKFGQMFANLGGRKDIQWQASEKENKTLLRGDSDAPSRVDIGALALFIKQPKGKEGIFDTKNLMHPQLASGGVLDYCN